MSVCNEAELKSCVCVEAGGCVLCVRVVRVGVCVCVCARGCVRVCARERARVCATATPGTATPIAKMNSAISSLFVPKIIDRGDPSGALLTLPLSISW
jgi:hypothetical protein